MRNIERFLTLDSTMLEARRNPTPGRIIVAEEQTAGIGSHGRRWHSPPGEGLYVSMVLAIAPAPVISLALGLATREAIGAGDLRWPNDVLIAERKCAGVLAQAEGHCTIAGIGINLTQRAFPADLDTPATSLALEGIPSDGLLDRLIDAVTRTTALPPTDIIERFSKASSYATGKRVRAGDITGVTCGLDAAGFLRVREDKGTVTTLVTGRVRPL